MDDRGPDDRLELLIVRWQGKDLSDEEDTHGGSEDGVECSSGDCWDEVST